MSWFDSSLSFAKTAFSQAQKSIDKVLDISETEQEGGKGGGEADGGDNSTSNPKETNSDSVSKGKSFDNFSSTWGGTDSFWSFTGSPSPEGKRTRSSTGSSTGSVRKTQSSTKLSTGGGGGGGGARSNRKHASSPKTTPTGSLKATPTESLKATPNKESLSHGPSSHFTEKPALTSTPKTHSAASEHSKIIPDPSEPVQTSTVSDPTGPISSMNSITSDTNSDATNDAKHGGMRSVELQVNDEEKLVDNIPVTEENKEPAVLEIQKDEHQEKMEETPLLIEDTKKAAPPTCIREDETSETQDAVNTPKPKDPVSEQVDLAAEPVRLETEPVKPVKEPVAEPLVLDSVVTPEAVVVENEEVLKLETCSDETKRNKETMEDESNERKDDNSPTSEVRMSPPITGTRETEKDNDTIKRLTEELAQTKHILEVRESKLMEMSQETMSLHEKQLDTQKELQEVRKELQVTQEIKEQLEEHSERLEKNMETLTTERNSLKKQVSIWEREHTQQKNVSDAKMMELLREKDEQIAGLMEEGEKLSKQELQFNNTIKKLRAKEKQNEQLIMAQKQQIEDVENEIKRLKEIIKKKEENEKKYQESLSQLNSISEQQAKELASIKPEKIDLQERVRSLQSNLDSTYKELTELRKTNAIAESAAEEAALYAKQNTRDELKRELEEQRLQLEKDKDALLMQVNELRMTLGRNEQQVTWREEQLRQEISDLHQRLQDSESRNQELSDTISNATRPLLRQIEHLQSAHSAQVNNWEKVESSLTQRIVDCQNQMNAAIEKERAAVEKEMLIQSRVGGLESQVHSLRQEKAQLVASFEMEKTKLDTLEETYQREVSRHEAVKSSLQQNVEELKKEKERVEHQLEYERARLEAESKKATLEFQEKEKLRNQLAVTLTHPITPSLNTGHRIELMERSISTSSETTLFGESTSSFSGSSLSVLEQLQSSLKQKEGELSNSQVMVASLERSRASLTQELATVSERNEVLEQKVKMIPDLQQKLKEMSQKHEALLQMFGEKAEETEELRMDIEDLKTMYRQQIEDLISKNQQHKMY